MKIIGIAGTNGAGKDSIGAMLAERHGFLFVSGSEMLREECRKRGLPVQRENLRMISAEWRRTYGLGVLVDRALELAKKGNYKGLATGPMRNVGEAQRAKELGGILVWVDADPKIRYERAVSRSRSEEDNKTFEQFLAEEEVEMRQSGDEATLNMLGVKNICDFSLENNGDDIEAFKDEAEKVLGFAQ